MGDDTVQIWATLPTFRRSFKFEYGDSKGLRNVGNKAYFHTGCTLFTKQYLSPSQHVTFLLIISSTNLAMTQSNGTPARYVGISPNGVCYSFVSPVTFNRSFHSTKIVLSLLGILTQPAGTVHLSSTSRRSLFPAAALT
jgi:hypothetical protein